MEEVKLGDCFSKFSKIIKILEIDNRAEYKTVKCISVDDNGILLDEIVKIKDLESYTKIDPYAFTCMYLEFLSYLENFLYNQDIKTDEFLKSKMI